MVRHWVHGEHLLAEGRKMAKSTGNVVLVSDVVARGLDPLALRLFFLTGRYRQQMNLTWDALTAADKRLTRWRSKVAEWAESPSAADGRGVRRSGSTTPSTTTWTPLRRWWRSGSWRRTPASRPARSSRRSRTSTGSSASTSPARWARSRRASELPAGAQDLLDARAAARAGKDFAESDRLRDALAGLGVAVTDTPGGQEWSLS